MIKAKKPMTDETKRKISLANKGRKPAPQTIAARLEWCRTHSMPEEQKQKISNTLKSKPVHPNSLLALKSRLGHKHSKESRKKISLHNKSGTTEVREKNRLSHLGKKQAAEQKEKSRIITTKLWQTVDYRNKIYMPIIFGIRKNPKQESIDKRVATRTRNGNWNKKGCISPEGIEKLRLARLKQVFPAKNSDLEVTVQKWLREENIPFHTHTRIYSQPDIFVTPNIVIQVDGCWWHPCLECHPDFYISERGINKRISDEKKNKFLIKHGYKLYRIKGHLILNEPESTKKQLIAFISRYMVIFNGT